MTILDVIIKILVAFVVITLYMKISSNIQLAPLTASDQVGNIVLGALIGGTLAEEVSVWMLMIAMVLWCSLQLFVRWAKYRSSKVTGFIDGKRIPLVREGELILDSFDKTKLLPEDFVLTLHKKGIPSVDDVWNAWFETDGTISVDKRDDQSESKILISNGSVVDESLKSIDKSMQWLKEELGKKGLDITEVFIAEWYDEELSVYPSPTN